MQPGSFPCTYACAEWVNVIVVGGCKACVQIEEIDASNNSLTGSLPSTWQNVVKVSGLASLVESGDVVHKFVDTNLYITHTCFRRPRHQRLSESADIAYYYCC